MFVFVFAFMFMFMFVMESLMIICFELRTRFRDAQRTRNMRAVYANKDV